MDLTKFKHSIKITSLVKLFSLVIWIIPLLTFSVRFESVKSFAFLIFGFLLTLFWICRILIYKRFFIFNKTDYFYLAWLLILFISSLNGVHPIISIIGGSYRRQGVLFYYTLWLSLKTLSLLKASERYKLNKGVALVILIQSFIVICDYLFGRLYLNRPLGTIGEPNALFGYLAIGTYFVTVYLPNLYLLAPLLLVLTSLSRSATLALMPNLIFLIKFINSKIKTFIDNFRFSDHRVYFLVFRLINILKTLYLKID